MGRFPSGGACFRKFRKCKLANCLFYQGLPLGMVHVFYIVIIEGKVIQQPQTRNIICPIGF